MQSKNMMLHMHKEQFKVIQMMAILYSNNPARCCSAGFTLMKTTEASHAKRSTCKSKDMPAGLCYRQPCLHICY